MVKGLAAACLFALAASVRRCAAPESTRTAHARTAGAACFAAAPRASRAPWRAPGDAGAAPAQRAPRDGSGASAFGAAAGALATRARVPSCAPRLRCAPSSLLLTRSLHRGATRTQAQGRALLDSSEATPTCADMANQISTVRAFFARASQQRVFAARSRLRDSRTRTRTAAARCSRRRFARARHTHLWACVQPKRRVGGAPCGCTRPRACPSASRSPQPQTRMQRIAARLLPVVLVSFTGAL
jgi:hypothetical protein